MRAPVLALRIARHRPAHDVGVDDAPAAFAEVRVVDAWVSRHAELVARAAEALLCVVVVNADLTILASPLVDAPHHNWPAHICLKLPGDVGILVFGHVCVSCIKISVHDGHVVASGI